MPVITYLEAIRQALHGEMARDARVFLMGEDIGAYGGAFKVTEGLLDAYGTASDRLDATYRRAMRLELAFFDAAYGTS